MNKQFVIINLILFLLCVTASCSKPQPEPDDIKNYKTVNIGDQVWMAENLRNPHIPHKSVDNKAANDQDLGYIYTWDNAMIACPPGYHLPTRSEFEALLEYVEKNKSCKSTFVALRKKDPRWKNDPNPDGDEFGFSALPAGTFFLIFKETKDTALFWSSSDDFDGAAASVMKVDQTTGSAYLLAHGKDNYNKPHLSVRCIKDPPNPEPAPQP